MSNITIQKGKDVSSKTGKEYEYYVLQIGDLYEHRFFATSKLEKAYLDKVITGIAHDSFNSDEEDDLQKELDGLFE